MRMFFQCCLLLQMVNSLVFCEMLKKCLFDNSAFEPQTGSCIPVPFISNSRRKKPQELSWEELQFLSKTVDFQTVITVHWIHRQHI